MSGRAAPRYAPEDPTLPKPWRGLVDGSTGYLYYWNPETNVTQYERPVPPDDKLPPPPPPLPPPPPRLPPKSAALLQREPDRDRSRDRDRDRDRDRSRDRGRDRDREHQRRPHRRESDGDKDDPRPAGSKSHQAGGSSRGVTEIHGHDSKDPQDSRATSGRGHGPLADAGSVEAYRRQHEIIVVGDDVPAPFTTFESAGFPSEILKEIQHAGFTSPTPIQAQSWPIALQSHDVVAIAKTGSGKTLGYLLPGFLHIKRMHNNPKVGPTVLVLAPTRELATQIEVEAVKFGRSSRIACTCLYGGAPKGPQLRDLERGVDVVVATPGRLNDILEMQRVSLRQVSYLVLDEADRMLDMGFEPQIRKIVNGIPHRRQTLMFTATWPKEVRKIASDLLVHPIQVNIGRIDELVANNAITQYVEVITPVEKLGRLEQILRSQDPGSKIIIFCTTKRMCDQLARTLTRKFGAAAIHGDKSQSEREKVLSQFRTGRSPILVATDVAARGLDIKDIRVVINYDFPTGVEDYVHRIGRTGRAGASGVAYTFFSQQDSKYAADLVKILEGANQRIPRELKDLATRGGKSRRRGHDRGRSHRRRSPEVAPSGRLGSARGGRGHDDRDVKDRSLLRLDCDVNDRYNPGKPDSSNPRTGAKRRSRSRSRSRSDGHRCDPSPKRAHIAQETSRSMSRSPSRSGSWNHGHSHSRSHSRSASHDFDQGLTGSVPTHAEPPLSPEQVRNSEHIHSPIPSYDRQQGSPPNVDDNMQNSQYDHSSSPQERPGGEACGSINGKPRGGSCSPHNGHEGSPYSRVGGEGMTDEPVSSLKIHLGKGREEEEEGMIPAEDDEGEIGRIIPDAGSIAAAGAKEPDAGN